jgi:hypothetical protein
MRYFVMMRAVLKHSRLHVHRGVLTTTQLQNELNNANMKQMLTKKIIIIKIKKKKLKNVQQKQRKQIVTVECE